MLSGICVYVNIDILYMTYNLNNQENTTAEYYYKCGPIVFEGLDAKMVSFTQYGILMLLSILLIIKLKNAEQIFIDKKV